MTEVKPLHQLKAPIQYRKKKTKCSDPRVVLEVNKLLLMER